MIKYSDAPAGTAAPAKLKAIDSASPRNTGALSLRLPNINCLSVPAPAGVAPAGKYNLDASKVTFAAISAVVGGPEYNKDFNENRAEYEKSQYVDISVK